MSACFQCGASLTADEIAIYRKLVSRDARRYLCKSCLAAYFDIQPAQIEQKIEQYKRQGCLLFIQEDPPHSKNLRRPN